AERPASRGPLRASVGALRRATGPGGDWPRTRRVVPWVVALFVAMLFLVPFDAVVLPVNLGVDSKIDRALILALALAVVVAWLGGGRTAPRLRRSPTDFALLAFGSVVVLSLALNLPDLSHAGQIGLALRRVALLASYAVFFYVVASCVRPSEVPHLVTLIIAASVLTALGTIVEYRSHVNVFYETSRALIPGATVTPVPVAPDLARANVVGPAGHGLADATLLTIALPFAVLRFVERAGWRRLLYGTAVVLVVAGGIATVRRTALIAMALALLVVVLYRGREVWRYLPLLLVALAGVSVLAPDALSGIVDQLRNVQSDSSAGDRMSDYPAVMPDIASHLVAGRGFGSLDIRNYRILDNQLLGTLIETGVLGLVAFLWVVASPLLTAHRVARAGGPLSGAAVAIIAASAGFLATNLLYDAFGFRQAIYGFFLIAGLAVVVARGHDEERVAADGTIVVPGSTARGST
ncbi:O-antigen ligase family protein, partial [Patulibacter sp. NPDC049589]|uniref:O-antigen ligase family protein n=1 Tax=Patulibacter sp. NPDC049589 TaxID=3154731 RepID=UPI00342611C6